MARIEDARVAMQTTQSIFAREMDGRRDARNTDIKNIAVL